MNNTERLALGGATDSIDETRAFGGLLSVQDLSVAFPSETGGTTPVRGVTFDIRRGSRVALVGESGSGKTLTALSLMGLVNPPGEVSGSVILEGRGLLSLSQSQMASIRGNRIAMVYQNPLSALNPLRRVGDQIVEAIRTHESVSVSVARRRAVDLLREVDLPDPDERVRNYPHELSGGMRQRVVIAMAVSCNPSLLIADEPTTALDVTTQARILRLMKRLGEDRGTAVLLITHDLGVAAEFSQEIRVMYAGRLVESALSHQFYDQPIHPYSEALVASLVGKRASISEPIRTIPGYPPSPDEFPPGCAFHPRCPVALDICQSIAPPAIRRPGSKISFSECHLAEQRYRALPGSQDG